MKYATTHPEAIKLHVAYTLAPNLYRLEEILAHGCLESIKREKLQNPYYSIFPDSIKS